MSIRHSFPPTPESVREARLFVLGHLPQLPQSAREQIGLIVSELATNAVVHAATAFTIALRLTAESLTIEVSDQGDAEPIPANDPPPADQLHGRGLLIVTRLATDWGITANSHNPGKTVWAKLALSADNASETNTKELPEKVSAPGMTSWVSNT